MIVIVQSLMDDCLMCLYESEYYEVVALEQMSEYLNLTANHTSMLAGTCFSVFCTYQSS